MKVKYNKLQPVTRVEDYRKLLQLATKLATHHTLLETEFSIVSSYESRAQQVADSFDALIIEAREILGLEVHKCQACGREESVCSADPCEAVIKDRNS